MDNSQAFVTEVLGKDGATAVYRAIQKNAGLQGFLVPRTVLGWAMSKSEFKGTVPGIKSVYLEFAKSASGISGRISVGGNPLTPIAYKDVFELSAEVINHLGVEVKRFEGGTAALVRLGKSIDALLKAREAIKTLSKAPQELPGTTAKPREPEGPAEPTKPIAVQPKIAKPKPKLPKLPMVKVELDKLDKSCKTCGGHLFKSQRFHGCVCFRDLAKHATTTVYSDGVVVEFSPKADRTEVLTLLREVNE